MPITTRALVIAVTEPIRECLPSRFEQRRTRPRHLLSRRHRAAEGIARSLGCFARNALNGTGHGSTVDGSPDAAEDGDAQRSAELGASLRDRRSGPSALGRGRPDDHVVCEGEYRR